MIFSDIAADKLEAAAMTLAGAGWDAFYRTASPAPARANGRNGKH